LCGKPLKTFGSQVLPCIHPPNYVGEANDLSLLAAQEGICLEEGDHAVEEVPPATNDEHVGVVIDRASVVLPDRPTVKMLADEIEHLFPASILADTKLRH
jgi:hypothetical protein